MTALDLIKSSLRLINALGSGETPSSDEAADALMVLNQMLDGWNAEHLMIFTENISTYPLVSGQQAYTLGGATVTATNLSTTRPANIDRVSILRVASPALEIPIEYTQDEAIWQGIPVKSIPGGTPIPNLVYDDGGFPLRTLYFWPTPNSAAYSAIIYGWTALTQFAVLTTDNTFPPGYLEALRYNLAVRLAPEWGKEPSTLILGIAGETKAKLKSHNISRVLMKGDPALASSGGNYNWLTDSVKGRNF